VYKVILGYGNRKVSRIMLVYKEKLKKWKKIEVSTLGACETGVLAQ